jgi:integron integrase
MAAAPPAPRLLDQLRQQIRYRHYSVRTEQCYVQWVRRFIRFHCLRHPRELGGADVARFLSHLANERRVSASTHKQALCAVLFLYKQVLGVDLPWMQEIGRPLVRVRIPVVLSRDEVARLLGALDGTHALVARLLYGAGLRLLECLRLRVKDLDFDRSVLVVREGKGGKDRVVMLPQSLRDDLRAQLAASRRLWEQDRQRNVPGVWLPEALARKFPRAAESWAWHWVWPSPTLAVDPWKAKGVGLELIFGEDRRSSIGDNERAAACAAL